MDIQNETPPQSLNPSSNISLHQDSVSSKGSPYSIKNFIFLGVYIAVWCLLPLAYIALGILFFAFAGTEPGVGKIILVYLLLGASFIFFPPFASFFYIRKVYKNTRAAFIFGAIAACVVFILGAIFYNFTYGAAQREEDTYHKREQSAKITFDPRVTSFTISRISPDNLQTAKGFLNTKLEGTIKISSKGIKDMYLVGTVYLRIDGLNADKKVVCTFPREYPGEQLLKESETKSFEIECPEIPTSLFAHVYLNTGDQYPNANSSITIDKAIPTSKPQPLCARINSATKCTNLGGGSVWYYNVDTKHCEQHPAFCAQDGSEFQTKARCETAQNDCSDPGVNTER